jgi:hypothetical protein
MVNAPINLSFADGKLSLRINPKNPNHHLFDNHGTWWLHATLHGMDSTKQRIRKNLRTEDLDDARIMRDKLFSPSDQI